MPIIDRFAARIVTDRPLSISERATSRTVAVGLLAMLLAGCDSPQSIVDPHGPQSQAPADLWWAALALGSVIYIGIVGLLLFALFRPRRGDSPDAPGPRDGAWFILSGGMILPVVVTGGLFVATLFTLRAMAEPEEPIPVTVEVIGRQWWWEVQYPDYGFVTANEIHIPVNQPVQIRVTTDDVIHSFWVPELSGKIDMIPEHVNEIWIEADDPGTYRGQCAEFCGISHANMAFHVVADPSEEFDAWVRLMQQPAAEPQDRYVRRGMFVFLGSQCVECHTIAGTPARARVGPNLTHLASRDYIAAGTLPMTPGSLGGWIIDTHTIKPGVKMPEFEYSPDDLQALIAYLVSLE